MARKEVLSGLVLLSLICGLLVSVGCRLDAGFDNSDCSIGSEACDCTQGGSCDPGLICASGKCVNPVGGSGASTFNGSDSSEGRSASDGEGREGDGEEPRSPSDAEDDMEYDHPDQICAWTEVGAHNYRAHETDRWARECQMPFSGESMSLDGDGDGESVPSLYVAFDEDGLLTNLNERPCCLTSAYTTEYTDSNNDCTQFYECGGDAEAEEDPGCKITISIYFEQYWHILVKDFANCGLEVHETEETYHGWRIGDFPYAESSSGEGSDSSGSSGSSSSSDDNCPRGCRTGRVCCGPPFCAGDCVGSPCC